MWSTEIPENIYAKLYVPWRRVRFEVSLISSILKKHNARRVVEFGCGVGRHGYLLSKQGFEVLLTDVRDWRYGRARRIPFKQYDLLKGGFIDLFDAGYAMATIIVFRYDDIIRVLRNIRENLRDRGVFIFDYNFTVHEEPERIDFRIDGDIYSALLKKNVYKEFNGGVLYEYRVEVVNSRGEIVGVEDTFYPIYGKEKIFRAVEEADYDIDEIIWLNWDPIRYTYRLASSQETADSALISIMKRS
ncbi:MAG: class I SAM-dependent methyltransferase [Sulfolobales archaeon]